MWIKYSFLIVLCLIIIILILVLIFKKESPSITYKKDYFTLYLDDLKSSVSLPDWLKDNNKGYALEFIKTDKIVHKLIDGYTKTDIIIILREYGKYFDSIGDE